MCKEKSPEWVDMRHKESKEVYAMSPFLILRETRKQDPPPAFAPLFPSAK